MKQIVQKANKEKCISIAKILLVPIMLLAIAYFVNTNVVRLAIVSGESMYPTLEDKDVLLINQVNYEPSRNDVVLIDVSESPAPGKYIVKRIIAVEGDIVSLDYESNSVCVNGIRLSEPYLNFDQNDPMIALDATNDITYQVPTGTVFVMGDNRNNSLDSRSNVLGMIAESDIVGKVCRHIPILRYFY